MLPFLTSMENERAAEIRRLYIVCCVKFRQNTNTTSNYVVKVGTKNARLIFSKLTVRNRIKSIDVHLVLLIGDLAHNQKINLMLSLLSLNTS